jgi:hypothetical protein
MKDHFKIETHRFKQTYNMYYHTGYRKEIKIALHNTVIILKKSKLKQSWFSLIFFCIYSYDKLKLESVIYNR